MYPEMAVFEMGTWDHVVATIICILAPVLALTSRKMAVEDIRLESSDKVGLYHSNSLLLIVFSLIVITAWRLPNRSLTGMGFDWPQWHPIVPVLLIFIVFLYFLDFLLQYGSRRRRMRALSKKHGSLAFVPSDSKELAHFIFLAIAAGIGEEIIFRGFLINYLISWVGNDFWGITIASLSSSALFAFLHGYQGWKSMVKIFVFSVLFTQQIIIRQESSFISFKI